MIRALTLFSYIEHPATARYRFELTSDLVLDLGRLARGVHSFRDDKGKEWARLEDAALMIRAGYSWDGCSPKLAVAGRWVGTPDFPETRMASLVHDVGYQFLHLPCFPFDRHEIDGMFREIMRRRGFKLGVVYFGAVWALGGIHRIFNRARSGACHRHP